MSAPNSHSANRLSGETSPYLLQHQHNPVDWWPWGQQALAHAQSTGRPILLSVGYAACHWCHVMAHESFEDAATAAVMNELFVNIKVDREERPDIDQIYMSALHHLGEPGGWPLTMFLTPQGEPVWGGTYFPKTSRFGKPAFVDVLRELARLFHQEPAKIEQNRAALMQRLAARAQPAGKPVIGRAELDRLAGRLASAFDPDHGGLQGAPKFPQGPIFELMWRAGLRSQNPAFFSLVDLTLTHICQGGIYDHLGGGFSRYSVDERWLVPHFEKMLYDNAHLLDLLALAFLHDRDALYRQRAVETVGWLAREMTTAEGAFAASLDADSEGEEGRFYVWSRAEIDALLGARAAAFAEAYDVTPGGNFEGHNILNLLKRLPRNNERSKPPGEEFAGERQILLAARDKRIRPGLDDKVLADWNGLMIAALAHAAQAFAEPSWLGIATRAFAFIADAMTRGDRLGHSWRAGKLLFPGLASDHAQMISAALTLHEATGEPHYLGKALAWQQSLDAHYARPEGGYYLTADDAEGLWLRPASTADDAVENHNATAAINLLRLAALAHDDRWRDAADRLFDALMPAAAENLFGHASVLNALDFRLHGAEVLVLGTGAAADALHTAALNLPHITRTVARIALSDELPASHPASRTGSLPTPSALVCAGERCSLPVINPEAIAQAVAGMRV